MGQPRLSMAALVSSPERVLVSDEPSRLLSPPPERQSGRSPAEPTNSKRQRHSHAAPDTSSCTLQISRLTLMLDHWLVSLAGEQKASTCSCTAQARICGIPFGRRRSLTSTSSTESISEPLISLRRLYYLPCERAEGILSSSTLPLSFLSQRPLANSQRPSMRSDHSRTRSVKRSIRMESVW